MQSHELKIWPPFFEHMLDGRKRFDVRKNDRDYKVGDEIKFREWVPKEHGYQESYYTGRNQWMRVRYILHAERCPGHGLMPEHVVLDLEPINLSNGAV